MEWQALGDSAWLFQASLGALEENLSYILHIRHRLELDLLPEIIDLVSSYDTIAVHFAPCDGQKIYDFLSSISIAETPPPPAENTKVFTIPVAYGGENGADLEALATATGLSVSEVIALHQSAEYTVATIGFSPGFPYLLGLPPQLHQPRHATPRKVPAGSVAIAGNQAGIYPFASQGGWHVIGRTDRTLFDPLRQHPSMLQPGNKIRFSQTAILSPARPTPTPSPTRTFDVKIIEPGALSTVQDHGRRGHQHLGISPSGAADPVLAAIANRLVGNPEHAAVIECTMSGPTLQFFTDSTVAWVGWGDAASGRPHSIKAGATINLRSRLSHLRGYIAVAGGFDVPEILGSRSTDLRALLGGHNGRPLMAGDTLSCGKSPTSPVSAAWHVSWPRPAGSHIEIRYLAGPQSPWFSQKTHLLFSENFYSISSTFDRTGTRLSGPKINLETPREMLSQPVVPGSIQVPPDGHPIILMSERQTIGGYPQIGHIISADLQKIARAWPGTRVFFREVNLPEARRAYHDLQRELSLLTTGLMLKLENP